MELSDAVAATAQSRRSKLESIDPSHLVLIARDAIFTVWVDRPPVRIVRMLESAAVREGERGGAKKNSEEAAWLLDVLTGDGPIPTVFNEFGFEKVAMGWFARVLSREESPRSWYYQWRALNFLASDEDVGDSLLVRAANGGFPPAMSKLGQILSGSEKLVWLRKAAEHNDPEGLSSLAFHDTEREMELLRAAAERGSALGIEWLIARFRDKLSPLARATLRARASLYTGNCPSIPELSEAVKRLRSGTPWGSDLEILYAVGRELEGYDELWNEGRPLSLDLSDGVKVYLSTNLAARRAALQTVVALRQQFEFPRDVAQLIARLVYASRIDPLLWRRK